MQNARAEVLTITNYCGPSSLVKPDTVLRALCRCVKKMDSLLIKQSESLLELSCDNISQYVVWSIVSSWSFYLYRKKEHLELSRLATEVLLLFGTTYLRDKNVLSSGSN
jgi:hypothetical protein